MQALALGFMRVYHLQSCLLGSLSDDLLSPNICTFSHWMTTGKDCSTTYQAYIACTALRFMQKQSEEDMSTSLVCFDCIIGILAKESRHNIPLTVFWYTSRFRCESNFAAEASLLRMKLVSRAERAMMSI